MKAIVLSNEFIRRKCEDKLHRLNHELDFYNALQDDINADFKERNDNKGFWRKLWDGDETPDYFYDTEDLKACRKVLNKIVSRITKLGTNAQVVLEENELFWFGWEIPADTRLIMFWDDAFFPSYIHRQNDYEEHLNKAVEFFLPYKQKLRAAQTGDSKKIETSVRFFNVYKNENPDTIVLDSGHRNEACAEARAHESRVGLLKLTLADDDLSVEVF